MTLMAADPRSKKGLIPTKVELLGGVAEVEVEVEGCGGGGRWTDWIWTVLVVVESGGIPGPKTPVGGGEAAVPSGGFVGGPAGLPPRVASILPLICRIMALMCGGIFVGR